MQRQNVTYFVEEFECELKDTSGRCLNVGSGTGEITRKVLLPVLNRDAVMIGTDVSESMVEYANRIHGVDGVLEFETLDIQTRDLPEKYVAEFDHVFSFPVLHFCNDVRQGLENIYKMLRPGGTFLMLWVSSHDMFKILENMAENKRFASYLYKYTAPFPHSEKPHMKLKELLRSIGFRIRHCSNREMSFVDKKPKAFLPTIISAFSFLREMPPDRAENFKNEFVREYTNRKYTRDNEELAVDLYKILVVYAQKQVL
ncbi:juvenile hormone acid O-methyltransferase-like isoform X1 [Temnothorax curvispinosus]|uniref:Juvenile hormone acid O-methyltransferase-like isoform X1 n=1 Tax=Temnothorax curvispinosus TaxID=300111 RepID=A0A6J1QAF0_9HYME|nr:juvenile hormone acid O-methyltransferase-like isoform X1 [Temnothorax curvispinosus]